MCTNGFEKPAVVLPLFPLFGMPVAVVITGLFLRNGWIFTNEIKSLLVISAAGSYIQRKAV